MALNIANIDRLLVELRQADQDSFDMYYCSFAEHPCGTAACISGHGRRLWGLADSGEVGDKLGLSKSKQRALFMPKGWNWRAQDFPLARAIDVVQHLRDTAEADPNGEGVVDWDLFPPENYRTPAAPKRAWSPPVAIEIAPELPECITQWVRQPVAVEG